MIEIIPWLPAEYQEVEYIKSSGTQYINTGFQPNNNTRIKCEVSGYPSTAVGQAFFGSRTSSSASDRFIITVADTGYRSDFYNNNVNFASSVNYSGRVTIDRNKNVTAIGSNKVTNTNGTFSGAYPLFLFAVNTGGAATLHASACLYSCQIYDNGTLVRDFVPCYRVSDNVAGLYDIVNATFYTNMGTGVFEAGQNHITAGGFFITEGGVIATKWALRRRSLGIDNAPFAFEYTGNYTDSRDANGVGKVRFTSSGTLTVLSGKVRVYVYILGGGGGGAYYERGTSASGGGGGNQTILVTLCVGEYEIIIGQGGAGRVVMGKAGDGGDTTAFNVTSTGGKGGTSGGSGVSGGDGGTPNGESGRIGEGSGGAPNGGSSNRGLASDSNGGNGYVELTFS